MTTSETKVTLTIDGVEVSVPKGTLLVDAAKQVGIEIPVFCYHPKLEPVGMCRMCLVEIGRPTRDRSTGEFVRDEDGKPVIQFGPKLETACTTKVDDGWVVNVHSERAIEGRKQVVEYLLTSHPLDCPICDKGGECPLQNLTLAHGPEKSRFLFDDKNKLNKHVPLGELIFLDRERCIQCARCIRFQEEIVDDPVIKFTQRGRNLEIVTYSEPGFNSYFSGNTTDICPVGALTTADFRFGARPWELNAAASICTHCPVGCNIILNTRREAKAGGVEVVKRVMPRQNEAINEIWICDKGRFAHAFAASPARMNRPLLRRNGKLEETGWEEALDEAARAFKKAGAKITGIAGGRASNEDLFHFRLLVEGLGGKAYLHGAMAGGDLIQKVGVGSGTNIATLGEGDAILVVASDLIEEAPIWWLRTKRAADRGANLIVVNARQMRLDKYAKISLRYPYGETVHTILGLLHHVTEERKAADRGKDKSIREAAKILKAAKNVIVFYGSEGLDFQGTVLLSQACASLLAATQHVGRANNGLIAVWPQNNTQGAWDMGLSPAPEDLYEAVKASSLVYVMAADPIGDDPRLAKNLPEDAIVVVQELFRTPTVERADIVFPAQSFIERDGSYTSGERIVQRFYPAVSVKGECMPDWQIVARLGKRLGMELNDISPAGVMRRISNEIADYEGVDYPALARVKRQWPVVGDKDLYFGGTAVKNKQGIGLQLMPATQRGEVFETRRPEGEELPEGEGLLLVPVTVLFDHGTTIVPSEVLKPRLNHLKLFMNSLDAERLDLGNDTEVKINLNGHAIRMPVEIRDTVPEGSALLPRSLGVSLQGPTFVEVQPVG